MRFYTFNQELPLSILMQNEYVSTGVYDPKDTYVMCDPETKTFETVNATGVSFALTEDELADIMFMLVLFVYNEDMFDEYIDDLWERRSNIQAIE